MDVVLKVVCGESQLGREVKIPLPKCLVGRNPECHLRFLHPAVSRRHCVLYAREGRVFVRDLDSHNGTLLNGQLLWDDHELKTGDTLQLGPIVLEVRILLEVFAGERAAGGEPGPPACLPDSLPGMDRGSVAAWLTRADEAAPLGGASEDPTRLLPQLDPVPERSLPRAPQIAAASQPASVPPPPSHTAPAISRATWRPES